ncbi:MAG: hypothetical protein IPM71_13660 [Bacteroidota bacterium]|nr:MAG: hypothetical protein IPM71_13660 [Bacteroidota bacterium]
MEQSNDQLILLLRDRIKKVIQLHEREKEKNSILEAEKKKLEQNVANLYREKEDFESKYNNLKLAKQLEVSFENTHDAKLKVNRIVREIDKCIALLNK